MREELSISMEDATEGLSADELLDTLESILAIANEEHFIRGADSKLYEIRSYARLALLKSGREA